MQFERRTEASALERASSDPTAMRSPDNAGQPVAEGMEGEAVWPKETCTRIRGFFDAIDHGWLVQFVEHRIADQRVVRLIQKWLNAGVLEDGKRTRVEEVRRRAAARLPERKR